MMKKVVLIAVIALLAFCSCKKADQSGPMAVGLFNSIYYNANY